VNTVKFLSACILFLWGLALTGAEPARTWIDLKGRSMEASFIKYSGAKIVIKRTDGRVFTVSPSLFSSADQKYLADLKNEGEYFKGATIVVSVKGEVLIDDPKKGSGGSYSDGNYGSVTKAKEGDILSVGSEIKVGSESEIILLFSNGTITTLDANTQMTVRKFLQNGFEQSDKKVVDMDEEVSSSTLLLDLQVGDMVVDVRKLRKKSNFEITSPLGVAGIRGTSFRLSASADSTKLSVLTGLVGFVSSDKKQNQVGAEKVLVSSKGKESVINDLADSQKQSITQTIAKAKEEAEEISLSMVRDKLGESSNSWDEELSPFDSKLSPGLIELFPVILNSSGKEVSKEVLAGKIIGIYFSANWSPPDRSFTPQLVQFRDDNKKDFEVVFVSSDRDPAAQMAYMKETKMRWYTMPHRSTGATALAKKYGIRGIPSLVVLSPQGKIITKKGRDEISSNPKSAWASWKKFL